MKTVNQWCKEFEEKNGRLATFDDFFNQNNKIAISLEATDIALRNHQKEITELQNKLHHRNMQIKESKNIIKILGEGLNAIRDTFYDTKQNPQVFIGNVETILNATKNKL